MLAITNHGWLPLEPLSNASLGNKLQARPNLIISLTGKLPTTLETEPLGDDGEAALCPSSDIDHQSAHNRPG